MVYNVEKMLKDSGDKVSGSDKSDVEAALAEAKTTLAGQSERGGAECRAGEADRGFAQAGRGDVQGQRGGSNRSQLTARRDRRRPPRRRKKA